MTRKNGQAECRAFGKDVGQMVSFVLNGAFMNLYFKLGFLPLAVHLTVVSRCKIKAFQRGFGANY